MIWSNEYYTISITASDNFITNSYVEKIDCRWHHSLKWCNKSYIIEYGRWSEIMWWNIRYIKQNKGSGFDFVGITDSYIQNYFPLDPFTTQIKIIKPIFESFKPTPTLSLSARSPPPPQSIQSNHVHMHIFSIQCRPSNALNWIHLTVSRMSTISTANASSIDAMPVS